MSAIMLPRLHIHCLVAAGFLRMPDEDRPDERLEALRFDLGPAGPTGLLSAETAEPLGQALVDANLDSVIAAGCALPDCIQPDDISPYRWPGMTEALTSPVQTLAAIACYEYQAGDHRGWKTSTARAYCEALRKHVAERVPGFDDAGWLLLAEKVAEATGWTAGGEPPRREHHAVGRSR